MTTTASPRTNWAGNIAFGAPDFYRPASLGELRAVVARARQVRVLGTGHSFNDMADSPGAQVSLAGLPPEAEVDSAASLVRVAAGLTYASLASRLDRHGFALRNLASLPHISVAGACATGTHGSGPANQNLSAAVTGLELVTAGRRRGRAEPRRRRLPRRRGAPRRARRGHPADPGAGAVLRGQPAGLRGPAAGRAGRPLRRDHGRRLQREHVHRLARPPAHPALDQEPGRGRDPGRRQENPGSPPPPLGRAEPGARPARRQLHRAARRARPLVRAAAALPARVHPERGRRAAVGVPAPSRARGARPARAEPGQRPVATVLRIAEIRRSPATTCG